MEGWLKIDSPHCRVLNGGVNDFSDLMPVHAPFYCGNKGDGQADLSSRSSARSFSSNMFVLPEEAIGLRIKSVELEVDGWPDIVEDCSRNRRHEHALPVCVNHHEGNSRLLGCPDEFDDI